MDPRAPAIRAGYATVAGAYAEHLSDELTGKALDRAMLDAFAAETVGRGQVVDVGCGPGQVAAYLYARGVAVEGVDLSPEMVAEARRRHPAIGFSVGDMFALRHAGLAGIVGFYALVHTPTAELSAPCAELYRVLAPGGLAMLAFHVGTVTNHLDELFGQPTSLDFWFHPAEAVMTALTEAGFTIEARLDRDPYPGIEYPSRRCYVFARRSSDPR